MKNKLKLIILFLIVFLNINTVKAVSEKYEIINGKWDTTVEANIKNTINGKKSTEYIISLPNGFNFQLQNNTNQFCVYPINHVGNNYILFPLANKCNTTISYSGTKNGGGSFGTSTFNVKVNSTLPELKKCTDSQKKSLGLSNNDIVDCYYCDSHQCLGNIQTTEEKEQVAIIYKEANKALKMQFGLQPMSYQSTRGWSDVNLGLINSVKSLKDESAILIRLSGITGKIQYLNKYNDDSIAGAGVIEVKAKDGSSSSSEITTLTKGCDEYYLDKIKEIDGIGKNLVCYYCDKDNCTGEIKVEKDIDTVAVVYRNASNALKISFDGSGYFQKKNDWQKINYHSIDSIYSAKGAQAILLNLTGNDGTLEYSVKYNNNKDAGSGKLIIGNGQNPPDGQTGDSAGELEPGEIVTGCEVIPEVIRQWIRNILNFVRYIALALVIALGALDFMKAAGSGEPDSFKKAGQSFMKRMIAVVILFLLPYIVDLILNMINIYGVDLDNPDCLGGAK